uniref:Ferric-chelate reductase 1 n=1 Tax=Aegilops tauschii TaxID=37682 RepID=M8B4K9_AEGTA
MRRRAALGVVVVVVLGVHERHYPNPPNPEKVLYINKKEAPLLKVERGVPVTFSVEAGHDVPLYITSDPVGGNATARNASEVIYAGDPTAEGVPATPTELVWLPDRNTPDLVYYQSLYDPKMGWKIQVVDGGLSDMYNNSVLLDDQQVTFFWTLSGDSINIAARGEKKSGYIAIGFGGAMVNSYAYVGWVDGNGTGHVNSYWIDGKDGMSVHETHENLTYKRCRSENGVIIFEFTRPLTPSCSGRVECKNIIDPSTPLKVIWAMGSQWSSGRLSVKNMHSVTSNRPVRILLLSGLAEAVEDLRPVLAVHGFMMFVAWGLLLPGGIVAARYLKHVKGDLWFQAHTYLQYSGLSVMFMGVLFAVAELRGFSFKSTHAKIGAIAFTFTCMQPVNAYLRPHRAENEEILSRNRIIWEYLHTYTGRTALVAAVTALFTGLQHLGHRYGSKTIKGLTCGLVVWVVSAVLVVAYLEYLKVKRRRDGADGLTHKFVLGNTEEDDSVDLLQSANMLGVSLLTLEGIVHYDDELDILCSNQTKSGLERNGKAAVEQQTIHIVSLPSQMFALIRSDARLASSFLSPYRGPGCRCESILANTRLSVSTMKGCSLHSRARLTPSMHAASRLSLQRGGTRQEVLSQLVSLAGVLNPIPRFWLPNEAILPRGTGTNPLLHEGEMRLLFGLLQCPTLSTDHIIDDWSRRTGIETTPVTSHSIVRNTGDSSSTGHNTQLETPGAPCSMADAGRRSIIGSHVCRGVAL